MLIASVAEAAHPAFAQKAPAAKQKAAVVFSRLIERWQKSDDPEETIAVLELALKLEPMFAAWPWTLPIKGSRQQKSGGTVQVWIAYSTRISCAKVWPAIRRRSARSIGPWGCRLAKARPGSAPCRVAAPSVWHPQLPLRRVERRVANSARNGRKARSQPPQRLRTFRSIKRALTHVAASLTATKRETA
jgi:hypothetical protein